MLWTMDMSQCSRLLTTFAMELVMLMLVGVFLAFGYLFCSTAEIPVTVISFDSTTSISYEDSATVLAANYFALNAQIATDTTLNITISFYVSIMAVLAFIGYFFLVLFGGAGLSALPIDLIRQFRSRPTFVSKWLIHYERITIAI